MHAITSFSIKGAVLASVAACAMSLSLPAHAQSGEVDGTYSTDLPQFGHLKVLEDRAADLQTNGAQDAAGRAQIIAAWQDLQGAAAQTLLADGSPHPLAHVAKLKIASQLYADGEIDAALALAQEGIAGSSPYIAAYPVTLADSAALVGVLLTQKGEPERALSMVETTYRDFTRLGDGAGSTGFIIAKSNLEHSLSQITLRMGRTQDALDYQKASLDTREASLGPNHPDTVAGYYNYAQTLRRADRMAEAEAIARIAVERASEHVDPSNPSYARSFEMLGIVLANSGRPIEATEFLTKALELKREYEGADTLIFGYGIHNLGTILIQREQYEEAQPLFTEAEAIMGRYQGPNSAFPILALAYNGQAALALGHPGEAVRLLDEGRKRLGEDTRDVEALARITPDLVRSQMLEGQQGAALDNARMFEERVLASDTTDAFEIAFATLLRSYAQSSQFSGDDDAIPAAARHVLGAIQRSVGGEKVSSLAVRHLAAIDLVMDIAAQRDDAELMLSAMSLVSQTHLARATGRRAEQLRAGNPDLAVGLRELHDAGERHEQADRALLLAIARGDATDTLRQELEQARLASETIEASLQRRFPQWAAARRLPQPSAAALQASLAKGEAVLAISPIYYGAYALLITPDAMRTVRLSESRKSIVDLANALGSSVRVGSFDHESSRKLGQALFPADVMGALAGIQSLHIYTNGPLASLPFSLLQGWDAADEGHWLLDRFSLSYLSDLSAPTGDHVGGAGDERTIGDGGLDLVAFAAPSPFPARRSEGIETGSVPMRIANYFGRDSIDVDALASLPSLPGTAEEIRTIAAAVPWRSQRLFIGAEANEAAVRREETSRADIIVLATHGIVAGEIEGIAEPALVLSPGTTQNDDGVLTASEIAQLDMRAEWIILSSCDSAAGMGGGLPAFSGLAQAFRQAGAKDLLVSHWKVRDDIAAFVSAQTVRNYRSGMSKTEALREAIRQLRTESGIEGADTPFAWAPFVLIAG